MNKKLLGHRQWSTSSLGSPPETSPMELAALEEHLHICDGLRGPLFYLECAGEATGRFMAPRLVTILVLFALASVAASLLP